MSDVRLPDNVDRWPDDPYKVLGVSQSADRQEVRRAYARLIRRYKPENSPREFRRIRDAYETVSVFLAWRVASSGPEAQPLDNSASADVTSNDAAQAPPAADDAPETEPAGVPENGASRDDPLASASVDATSNDDANDDANERRPRSRSSDQRGSSAWRASPQEACRRAWRSVRNGNAEEAYRRLLAAEERYRGHTDVCVRLYWLTKLWPHVDAQRTPCDWLALGLRTARLTGLCMELYRRELDGDPGEAATARCGDLLDVDAAAARLVDLTEWRWLAAGRIDRPDLVVADIDRLRPRIASDDEMLWSRLLFAALDQWTWREAPAIAAASAGCFDELAAMSHLHTALGDSMDRLETMIEAWKTLRKATRSKNIPAHWIELIAVSWSRPFVDLRPRLLRFAEDVARNPVNGLAHLDRLLAVAPSALARLGEIVNWLRAVSPSSGGEVMDDELATSAIIRWIGRHWTLSYRAMRPELVRFCCDSAIDPESMARHVDRHFAGRRVVDRLRDHVEADAPLRFAYRACSVFCE